MYIVASGGYQHVVNDDAQDLKPLLKAHCRTQFRRIDRFIQLALLGSALCVKDRDIANQCGLYLTSHFGALSNPIEVFDQIFNQKIEPKPLNFINTLGNSACFYLANAFQLNGINQCISSGIYSFEAGLQFADLDFLLANQSYALIGSVDECPTPTSVHRQRLKLPTDAIVEEASFWALVSKEQKHVTDKKLTILSFNGWQDVVRHTQAWRETNKSVNLNIYLAADISEPLEGAQYWSDTNYFSSTQAAQVLDHINRSKDAGLFIGKNPAGPYTLLQIDN